MKFRLLITLIITLLANGAYAQAATPETATKLLFYFVYPTSAHVPVPSDEVNLAQVTREDAARPKDTRGVVKVGLTRKLALRFGDRETMNAWVESARETRLAHVELNRDLAREFVRNRLEVNYQVRF